MDVLDDTLREMEKCKLEIKKPNEDGPRIELADSGDVRVTNMQELENLYRKVDQENLERLDEEFVESLPVEEVEEALSGEIESIESQTKKERKQERSVVYKARRRLRLLRWEVGRWPGRIRKFFRSSYHTSAMVIFGRPTFLKKETALPPSEVSEILVDMENCELETGKPGPYARFTFNLPYRRGGLIGWIRRILGSTQEKI